jgi:hypothetical protein
MTTGQVITIVVYTTVTNANEVASAWVTAVSTVQDQAVVDGIQMNGWNFAPTSTSSSSSGTSTNAASSTNTPTSTNTSTSTDTAISGNTAGPDTSNASAQSKQASGLSTGAKAGIGVACGIVGLAAIVFALLYFRARSRSSSGALLGLAGSSTVDEAAKGYYAPPTPPQEMHAATWRAEMMTYGGHQDRAELADRQL